MYSCEVLFFYKFYDNQVILTGQETLLVFDEILIDWDKKACIEVISHFSSVGRAADL